MARAMVNEVGINYADSQSTPPALKTVVYILHCNLHMQRIGQYDLRRSSQYDL